MYVDQESLYNSNTMSIQLSSPWLHQLQRVRPVDTLESDADADVVVVGGGIAGIATAYYLLKETSRSVLLLEKGKVAHGATGHNAGQLVEGFEKPFKDIVEEFGVELTTEGIREMESAWVLYDAIIQNARLRTPQSQFLGYSGYVEGRVIEKLETEALREKSGLLPRKVYIAEEQHGALAPKSEYRHLYEIIPHKNILTMLETNDASYVAASTRRKGCMNSALFTEELAGYLLSTFPSRFALCEHADVSVIELQKESVLLKVFPHQVGAKEVVLATNGFEKITLKNETGPDINTSFHHLVHGLIGYMAGYLEPIGKSPTAIAYHTGEMKDRLVRGEDPYFYLTRRPYEMEANEKHNLVCVGGPEEGIADSTTYIKEKEYPENAREKITAFLRKTYAGVPESDIAYAFSWHGLMGYTPNGIRVVGKEPKNPLLMYNLGCNGIGILPSITGGLRIAKIVQGDSLPPSIFDPKVG